MAAPEDLCGFQPELPEDWTGDSPVDGVRFGGEYSCCRPAHGNGERCIWHARRPYKRIDEAEVASDGVTPSGVGPVDAESELSNRSRILTAERIDDAYLTRARFEDLNLKSLHFYNSRFDRATFTDALLELVTFTHCLFDEAKFRECTIGATFEASSVCLAEFKDSEFTGARVANSSLIGIRFYSTDFKASTFDEPEFSREVLFSGCSIDYSTDFEDISIQNSGSYEHEARTKVYGQLASMCLSSRELNKYIKYKKLERYYEGRKQLYDLKDTEELRGKFVSNLVNYLSHEYSRVTMGYGYSIGRVLFMMLFVLAGSALLYTGLDCTLDSLRGVSYACADGVGLVRTFFDALYFSVVTFTSLGYGDIVPVGAARFVAIIEALAGLIIGAQFVYVLATKTGL